MTKMTMMQTYKTIAGRDDNGKSPIEGKEFRVLEDCKNDFRSEVLAVIPAGTMIVADFAGNFGMYAMGEIAGVLHRLKFNVEELHKIDFGAFDARNISTPTDVAA